MDHDYSWNFTQPGKSINVHMQNYKDGDRVFDATLLLNNRVKLIESSDGVRTFSESYSDCLSSIVPNISSTCFDTGGCIISITSDGVAEHLNKLNINDLKFFSKVLEH